MNLEKFQTKDRLFYADAGAIPHSSLRALVQCSQSLFGLRRVVTGFTVKSVLMFLVLKLDKVS